MEAVVFMEFKFIYEIYMCVC